MATKFPPSPRSTADDLPRALSRSLSRLQRGTVDVYQHHFPSRRVDISRLMVLMADAVAAGQVRAVGVSNYGADQMRLAHAVLADRGVPLASNQVQYSLLHRRPEANGVLDACRELGVTLIAYQPLASGALTGKYLTGHPTGLRRLMPQFRRAGRAAVVPVVGLLGEIAAAHDTGASQIALAWLLQDDTVLPIPGAKNRAQAVANAEALGVRLDAGEVAALEQATRAWRR
jgi:aryl-alcohol dehydrogenase-like predicted oxidoreductase